MNWSYDERIGIYKYLDNVIDYNGANYLAFKLTINKFGPNLISHCKEFISLDEAKNYLENLHISLDQL